MKKVVLDIIGFVFIAGFVISGCSQGTKNPIAGTATPEFNVTPTTIKTQPSPTPTRDTFSVDLKKLKGLQIQFMHPWMGSTQNALFSMVDEFNQGNEWGIHVIMNAVGSEATLEQKVWQGFQNQDAPDVVAAPTSLLLAFDEKNGQVVDLNQYLELENFGLSINTVNDFNQTFWGEDEIDGKRYGIPAQRTAAVLFYNLTWAKELGFSSVPRTLDEFKDQVCGANQSMRKDTDTTNDGIGGMLISTDSASMLSWLNSFGAELYTNDRFTFNSPDAVAALESLLELKTQSCAWSGKTVQPYDYFATRKALVYSGQMQELQLQQSANQRTGASDEWMVIPYPGVENEPTLTSGFSYGILKSEPENNLAAWLFIRWLSEPAQQARLLNTFGTLPLGKEVLPTMRLSSSIPPQWWTFVESQFDFMNEPLNADWNVIKPILEDASWQLFKTEIKPEQVVVILKEVDELVAELSERYP